MWDYLKHHKNNFKIQKILDIGANNGQFCRGIKNIFPHAHVTSIEAGEKYKSHLEKCADSVHIAVLGNERKLVDMYLIETKPGKPGYSKGSNLFGKGLHKDKRQMLLLSDVVNDRFDLIKQDVQGAEIMIMKGSSKIFQQASYVINEVNTIKTDRGEPILEEMNDFMFDLGFNNHVIITNSKHKNNKQVDVLYYKT